MVEKLGSFTQVKFVTSDGEKCVATKNNGMVTIHGDKKGVRQLPINVFMQELIADQQKISLEKSPKQDTVSFSGGNKDVKYGPAGFGPGHPNYVEKKNKGLILGLGALVVGGLIYALTKGKVKSNAIANMSDDATKLVRPVADDVASASKNSIQVIKVEGELTSEKIAEVVREKFAPKVTNNVKSNPIPVQTPKSVHTLADNLGGGSLTFSRASKRVTGSLADDAAKGSDLIFSNLADDVAKTSTKSTGLVDDLGCKVDDLGYKVDDAINYTRRGAFGQDLYDATEPLNKYDMLSPYYKSQDPFKSSLDDMLDPLGLNNYPFGL